MLGQLSAGRHRLSLHFATDRAAAGAGAVVLSGFHFTTYTPLVAWHEATPAATPGHTDLQYSIIWSNEDGGTNTPQLMSRWGRSTDIEWIYRVEIDQHGNRVAGSDTYQAANHVTTYFHDNYENDHAVLDTCTSNNNICDTVNDPMRFFLSAQQNRRPASHASTSWTPTPGRTR